MVDARAAIAETDLEVLEDVERQCSLRVVNRKKYRGRGFGTSVSVGLSHASPAREKPPAKAAKPKPAAAIAPTLEKPPSPVGRLISNYADVLAAFRARCDELEVSRLELDHLSGVASGYSSILLSKSPRKNFGPVSLGLILDALGLRLLVVEDPELTAHTLKHRTKRVNSHAHYAPQLAAPTGDTSTR